jgi:acetyl esterase/lipase
MAAPVTIMAQERSGVRFVHQSLYYPVTDAGDGTDSYREFADGPFLTAQALSRRAEELGGGPHRGRLPPL